MRLVSCGMRNTGTPAYDRTAHANGDHRYGNASGYADHCGKSRHPSACRAFADLDLNADPASDGNPQPTAHRLTHAIGYADDAGWVRGDLAIRLLQNVRRCQNLAQAL